MCKQPGLNVIKLEFILRLKIKRDDWLLADKCLQAANHCAVLKFYNLEAWEKISLEPGDQTAELYDRCE